MAAHAPPVLDHQADPAAPTVGATGDSAPPREPLRLWLEPDVLGRTGAWWPQSRSLALEVADLVDHFPNERGRISRAVYSPPDWDTTARRVPVRRGYVKLGAFPRDDTREMRLALSDRTVLVVRVIPPSATAAQAEELVRELGLVGPRPDSSAGSGAASVPRERGWSDRWSDDGGS